MGKFILRLDFLIYFQKARSSSVEKALYVTPISTVVLADFNGLDCFTPGRRVDPSPAVIELLSSNSYGTSKGDKTADRYRHHAERRCGGSTVVFFVSSFLLLIVWERRYTRHTPSTLQNNTAYKPAVQQEREGGYKKHAHPPRLYRLRYNISRRKK